MAKTARTSRTYFPSTKEIDPEDAKTRRRTFVRLFFFASSFAPSRLRGQLEPEYLDESFPTRRATHFVNAVHRRLMLLRAAEQIGRGMMIASLLAILLAGIAIWQSMPALPVLIFCGILGLLIGAALTLFHWPTRLSAAVETDRQLRLQELLTTSMSLTGSDDFAHAVFAMADARCQLHSPSEVVLGQLGIRSWSGIALTMSIAATLAAIPLGPSRSQATDANISVLSQDNIQLPAFKPIQQSPGTVARINDPQSENSSNDSMSDQTQTDQTGTPASPAFSQAHNTSGAGGGSSQTTDISRTDLQPANSSSHAQSQSGTAASGGDHSGSAVGHGETTGGTQRATDGSKTQDLNVDGSTRSRSPAFSSAADDRIPAEDRDLVRDFFNQR